MGIFGIMKFEVGVFEFKELPTGNLRLDVTEKQSGEVF
jgi:hypothetical protein